MSSCSGGKVKNVSENNQADSPSFLEVPDCRQQDIKASEFKKYEGRIQDQPLASLRAARCYFKFNQLEASRLFFNKAAQANQVQIKYQALLGEYEIYQRRRDIQKMNDLLTRLKTEFSSQLMVWVFESKIALDFYDLPRAEVAVNKLKRFKNKSFYKLYLSYLELLKDNKQASLNNWKALASNEFSQVPQAAFTASYLGYLLNDKIKARGFLIEDHRQFDSKTYDQLKAMLR